MASALSDCGSLRLKQSQLCDAIEAGDAFLVREILADGSLDLNIPLSNGCTPLIQAIQQGHGSVVKILLEQGASASQAHTVQGFTLWSGANMVTRRMCPLAAAVEQQNSFIIELLLSKGAPLEHCKGGLKSLLHLAVRLDCQNLLKLVLFIAKTQEEETGLLLPHIDLGEPLMAAVTLQKLKMAQLLLELGATANHHSGGLVPLVAAANNGNSAMCKLLLGNGATLGRITVGLSDSHTPLSFAILGGLVDAVSMLIQLGSDVNLRSVSSRSSMLHLAVGKSHLAITKMLIAAGCAVNCKDSKGNTPLHVACMDKSGKLGAARYLLQLAKDRTLPADRVPNIDAVNLQGHTPVMLAIACGNVETASQLIQAGADLDLYDKQHFTALHHAVQQGSDILALELLRSGVNVNAHRKKFSTPLHEAVRNSDYTIVDVLLDYKADVNLKTALKETPLHLAVRSQGEDLVEYFLNLGLDINAKTTYGETPLMIAATQDSPDICELLISSSADMDCHDYNQRETALTLSVYLGFEENARMLIVHGANLDATDKRSNSAIYWSIFNARIQSLLFLIMAGAAFGRSTISNMPQNSRVRRNQQLYQWMLKMVSEVRALQDLCRLAIRASLRRASPGRDIVQRVESLAVPERMKKYLTYRTSELKEIVEWVAPGLTVTSLSPGSDTDS